MPVQGFPAKQLNQAVYRCGADVGFNRLKPRCLNEVGCLIRSRGSAYALETKATLALSSTI
jgi:hypothetical protein